MTHPTVATVETSHGPVSYAHKGEGAPLVLLHSLLTDRRAFDRVIGKLPGRIIAIDLPGFGATALTEPSIESYASLINSAVRAICGEHESVTVMGNGLGAFVGLGMAIGDGNMLDRLVLVGCGVTFPEEARPAFGGMIEAVESGGLPAVTPIALRRIFTEQYLEAHPEEAEERSSIMAATDPEAFMRACRALQRVDFRDRLADVEVPTLIIVGEEDQATPPEMAIELNDSMPASTLVILPGVAHAPQIQDPASFVSSLGHFVHRG
jgi:3-oxoadipate enol-lactonase